MVGTFKSMIREDDAATMVEYGLLLGLIALVAFTGAKILGRNLDRVFDAARDAIRRASG